MSDNQVPQTPAPPANSWRLETWFPDLEPSTLKNMKNYHDELVKWNRSINLVSPKTLPFADAIHFGDSILASRIIYQDNPKMTEISDVGSGNGFPGMIFAMLLPKIKVRLIDNDLKKCEFLNHLVKTLKLHNVEVVNKSVDAMEPNCLENCLNRGFASISKTILMTRKQVKKGGVFYHLKGDAWPAEVGEIPTQLCSVWAPALVGEYKLPIGTMKFAVVKTDKIA